MSEISSPRPTISSEVRAWVGVGAALILQIIGGVWWAATLSQQNTQMNDLLKEMRAEMKGYAVKAEVERRIDEQLRLFTDHEARLRYIERNAKFGAAQSPNHRDHASPGS